MTRKRSALLWMLSLVLAAAAPVRAAAPAAESEDADSPKDPKKKLPEAVPIGKPGDEDDKSLIDEDAEGPPKEDLMDDEDFQEPRPGSGEEGGGMDAQQPERPSQAPDEDEDAPEGQDMGRTPQRPEEMLDQEAPEDPESPGEVDEGGRSTLENDPEPPAPAPEDEPGE